MDGKGSVAGASPGREIPSSQKLKLQMSDEKFEEMLQARRDQERQDELKQIGSLGMVDKMKDRLDRRLGRNLAMKQSRGPLEQRSRKLSKSHSMKRRKLRRNSNSKWYKSMVGHEALREAENGDRQGNTATHFQKMASDQQDELKSIEELNLVAKPSTRETISHHIASHAARLSNHRLTILPSSSSSTGRRRDRKKSSVLVTSVEEDEELVRELHRQQSRVFIESIIQCPSRQQRVLEKLSTEQMQRIKDVEEKKWKKKKSSAGSTGELEDSKTSLSHKAPDQDHLTDVFPPPIPEPALSSDSYNQEGLKEASHSPKASISTADESSEAAQSSRVVCDGDEVDEQETSKEDVDGAVALDHVSPLLQESKMMMSSGYMVEVDTQLSYSADMGDLPEQPGPSTGLAATLAPQSSPPVAGAVATSQRITYDEVTSWVEVEPIGEDEDPLTWAESSEDSMEPSAESSPMHMSHSSPQLARSMSSVMRSLSGRTSGQARHGTYGKVEVEINPFASEFKKGVRPEDSVNKLPHFTSLNRLSSSRPGSASRKLKMSGNMLSPVPCLSPLDSGRTAIPKKAFRDPGFIAFMEELGKEPEVSDYVLYKMRVIGDEIEKKYSKELNQAMDEVFFEVVKHSLSWQTFKSVSKKLLVCGSRIQDSILLVPCFARRVVDMVPQMGGRIADYTEEVLDSYAADSILGMGGWNTFMESYEDVEAGVEQDMLGSAVDPVQPVMSPMVPGPYATLPTKRRKPLSPKLPTIDVPLPTEEVSVTQSLSSHQQALPMAPLALRRCNSVEVLFPEEDHEQDVKQDSSLGPPPFLQTVYSRSISVNSLDLATPSSANPRLSVRESFVRSESHSSVITGRFSLTPLPEEDVRVISRRSSVCSITLVSSFNATDVEPDIGGFGFEVIGRQDDPHKNREDDHHKNKDLTDSTSSSRQSHTNTPPVRTDSNGSSASGGESENRRRRRSSAEIAAPLVAIATHAIAFSCYYFSQ